MLKLCYMYFATVSSNKKDRNMNLLEHQGNFLTMDQTMASSYNTKSRSKKIKSK
jgi:hypothetical protein